MVVAAVVVAVRGPLRRLDPRCNLLLIVPLVVKLPLLRVTQDLEP